MTIPDLVALLGALGALLLALSNRRKNEAEVDSIVAAAVATQITGLAEDNTRLRGEMRLVEDRVERLSEALEHERQKRNNLETALSMESTARLAAEAQVDRLKRRVAQLVGVLKEAGLEVPAEED